MGGAARMTRAGTEDSAKALDGAFNALTGPIAVVGGAGMLGRAFGELMQGRVEHRMFTRDELNILDGASMGRSVRAPWKTYINCSAYTDVDGAEADEKRAMDVNGAGVAMLARSCREAGATLVHFSSDYVFDGRAASPYKVDQRRAPAGVYARSKAAGEEAIEREATAGLDALVIRTSWLYAPWGKNFVRTIAKFSRERPTLKVVSDQRGRPTSAEWLARATVLLLARQARGVFHATDGGECTWFDFAMEIAAHVNPTCRVTPCTTAEFPRPAPRPAYSVLDLSKTESLIGPMPHWKANLANVLPRLEA